MVIEDPILPTYLWLFPGPDRYGALANFAIVVVCVTLLGLVLGYAAAAFRHGPFEAFYAVTKVLFDAFAEVTKLSPRRIFAMSQLAFKEAIRRWVLVAFVVFILVLLFAGWFLDRENDSPARIYLSFVLSATNYLVLLLALFLSAFSLPTDIKNRTIFTVVTKPVFAWEIILGRILGFSAIGTAMICGMGLISYVFVVRGLSHSHRADVAMLEEVTSRGGDKVIALRGETTYDSFHRHTFAIDPETNKGRTDVQQRHYHDVELAGDGDDRQIRISGPRDHLQARVTQLGKLRFLDRNGQPASKGVNVGNEWMYRSFIEGGSLMAAIWKFDGITEDKFPNGIPLEMTIRVFRTYKGDVERGIFGSIQVKNPDRSVESVPLNFTAREFTADRKFIPRKLKAQNPDGSLRDVDLFEDLVDRNGEVEIWVRCGEPQQYFGMAEPDLYIRHSDGWFAVNFFKGYLSIWCQMVLVVCFGVFFSTFLSAPVAMMATLSTVVLGFFTDFIMGVISGDIQGGGPIESAIRIPTQMNLVTEINAGFWNFIFEPIDFVMLLVMRMVLAVLPDYATFSTARFVADGYNIKADLMVQHLIVTAGYFLAITVVSYFFLKTRETGA